MCSEKDLCGLCLACLLPYCQSLVFCPVLPWRLFLACSCWFRWLSAALTAIPGGCGLVLLLRWGGLHLSAVSVAGQPSVPVVQSLWRLAVTVWLWPGGRCRVGAPPPPQPRAGRGLGLTHLKVPGFSKEAQVTGLRGTCRCALAAPSPAGRVRSPLLCPAIQAGVSACSSNGCWQASAGPFRGSPLAPDSV